MRDVDGLVLVTEGVSLPPPGPRGGREMKFAMAAADVTTPVESGSLEVTVAVEVSWELD